MSKTHVQRINNVIGQLIGVREMVGNKSDCVSTLTQLKAIRSAVRGIMDAVIEEQFNTCIKSLSSRDKKLFSKLKTYVSTN